MENLNALEFKEMLDTILSEKEKAVLEHARGYFSQNLRQITINKNR